MVCAAVNGWDNVKKLLRLSTLLRGHTWVIYDLLDEEVQTHTPKSALLQRLCPDIKDNLAAQEYVVV